MAASAQKLTPTSPVTLRWDNGGARRLFEIALSVDENYMISARQERDQPGATGAVAVPDLWLYQPGRPSGGPFDWTIHTGPIGVFNGAANYSIDFRISTNRYVRTVSLPPAAGSAFTDHWLAALVPTEGGFDWPVPQRRGRNLSGGLQRTAGHPRPRQE